MTTCEICGRPVGYEWGQCPHRMDGTSSRCYQLGYEREKARADALAAKVAEASRLRPMSEVDDHDGPVLVAAANGTWKLTWVDIETIDGKRTGSSRPLGWMPLPPHPSKEPTP